MIRPEVRAALWRWREVLASAAVALIGVWIATRGGWFLAGVGGLLVALGLALGLPALRRMRFAARRGAPGVIEIDEGQLGYLGPDTGGFVALGELVEIRLIAVAGRRHWRLKQADGQALLVPVDAAGAEGLYDAFATLPGIDMGRLVAALDRQANPQDLSLPLWRRTDPFRRP